MTNQDQAAGTPSNWTSFISPFAQAIGKELGEVEAALKALVGEPSDNAVALLQDESFTPFEEIKGTLPNVPTAVLKKAVNGLRKVAAPVSSATILTGPSFAGLPQVPDDEAWLSALKIGGELKVDVNSVTSGMRAGLASRTGLYDVLGQLATKMEDHAESLDEPVGAEYLKIRGMLTKRGNYAEIFAALGVEGSGYATQARKDAFIQRLDEVLWPALYGFNQALHGWTKSWQDSMGNPAAMMTLMLAGQRGSVLPPGMMQPPATDSLRDSAEAVVNKVNRVFAGHGIIVASAMAYDAMNIKRVLETPNLPQHVGAANREQMLRMLGVEVAADYVRLERNVIQYALSVMEYAKVTADTELGYLTSLQMLGSQIPWEKLSTTVRPRVGRGGGFQGQRREEA